MTRYFFPDCALTNFPKLNSRHQIQSYCKSGLAHINMSEKSLTQVVRGKKASINRMIPEALPNQNHGAGDGFRISLITPAAYSSGFIPSVFHDQHMNPASDLCQSGRRKLTWRSVEMLPKGVVQWEIYRILKKPQFRKYRNTGFVAL